jgi:hypothetical protein
MRFKQIKSQRKEKQMKTKSFRKRAAAAASSSSLVWIAAALLILTACSTTAPPPPKGQSAAAIQEGVPGGIFVNTMEVSARVTAINKADREVMLLASDGKKYPVEVGPEAVNFDQIRVGDLVKATVTEELVIFMDDAGAPATEGQADAVALAPKGAKPGGVVAQTTQVIGTVEAIDRTKRTAKLRFEDGSVKTFPVRDDIDLSRHEVGERVVFRVTEMVAISVKKQ